MLKFTSAVAILLIFASFCPTNEVTDAIKHKMFCCACEKGGSTSQDYVVVKVKNLKTGELKDICVTLNLLEAAIWRETGQLKGLDCKEQFKRYFEFSKDSALWNIGYNEYSMQKLTTFQKHLNTDSIVGQIKAGKFQSVNFGKNERYFAHIMFNRGVVTTSGCFGTDVSYFNPALKCDDLH
ncbi:MAG: hypothetical protein K9G49_07530 [Taibaiella sp.]|nr:hypothetical protein [Taibaiella sp.]